MFKIEGFVVIFDASYPKIIDKETNGALIFLDKLREKRYFSAVKLGERMGRGFDLGRRSLYIEICEKKFGFIFIVCATGKSASEMLELLNKRLPNTPDTEIKIAAREQNKITHLRINKLFS